MEFAAEAVQALDNVLKPATQVVHEFTATPTVPVITGATGIGSELTADWRGDFSHQPNVSYQWYRNGVAIPGADTAAVNADDPADHFSTYTLTSADEGKRITFGVTGARAGYQTVTRLSTPTGTVGAFGSSPFPIILGTPKIGNTLGLDTGNWSPAASFSFQWKADGSPIGGATTNRYTVRTADLGKKITVTVTASAAGYTTTSRTSLPTAAVALVAFSKAPTPLIVGTAKLGNTLGLNSGSWAPAATFRFQWNADGRPIGGATANQYAIRPADVGKRLTVTITATAVDAGYAVTARTSAATAVVQGHAFTKAPKPKITGTPTFGKTLTATAGAWAPKAGTSLGYQWYAGGKAIKGATGSKLKLGAAQVGKTITVKVTAKKTGYNTVTKTSSATKKVAALKFAKSPTPKVKGTAKVGRTLSVTLGTWSPKAGTAFTYQWYAGGKAIGKATSGKLTLTSAQKGKKITVKVTATKAGYAKVSKTSKATAKVN